MTPLSGFEKKKKARAAREEKMTRAREAEISKWAATQKKWTQEDSAAEDRERSLKSQLARDEGARLDMGHGLQARTVPDDVRSLYPFSRLQMYNMYSHHASPPPYIYSHRPSAGGSESRHDGRRVGNPPEGEDRL